MRALAIGRKVRNLAREKGKTTGPFGLQSAHHGRVLAYACETGRRRSIKEEKRVSSTEQKDETHRGLHKAGIAKAGEKV